MLTRQNRKGNIEASSPKFCASPPRAAPTWPKSQGLRAGKILALRPILGIFAEVLSRTMSHLRIPLPISAAAEINSHLYRFEETRHNDYSQIVRRSPTAEN